MKIVQYNFLFFSGNILTAFITRAWSTSISIALMISICYSSERARRYFWLYHLYGWLFPVVTTFFIYLTSTIDKTKHEPVSGVVNFGTLQICVTIFFLGSCIIITSVNLIRIARRKYKLKHAHETSGVSFTIGEIQPLIRDEIESSQSQISIQSIPTSNYLFASINIYHLLL
jgi:hypothetical protein